MKSSAKKVELASVDDLFSTEESRADAQREKVLEIPLSELHPFKDHPFKVKDDEAMMETADSIRQYGVLVPAIARPDPNGGYELVAGHRRHRASELAGKDTIDILMEETAARTRQCEEYFSDYRRYQLMQVDKVRVLLACRVIINDLLGKLYRYDYNVGYDCLLDDGNSVSRKLKKSNEEMEVEETTALPERGCFKSASSSRMSVNASSESECLWARGCSNCQSVAGERDSGFLCGFRYRRS